MCKLAQTKRCFAPRHPLGCFLSTKLSCTGKTFYHKRKIDIARVVTFKREKLGWFSASSAIILNNGEQVSFSHALIDDTVWYNLKKMYGSKINFEDNCKGKGFTL